MWLDDAPLAVRALEQVVMFDDAVPVCDREVAGVVRDDGALVEGVIDGVSVLFFAFLAKVTCVCSPSVTRAAASRKSAQAECAVASALDGGCACTPPSADQTSLWSVGAT